MKEFTRLGPNTQANGSSLREIFLDGLDEHYCAINKLCSGGKALTTCHADLLQLAGVQRAAEQRKGKYLLLLF